MPGETNGGDEKGEYAGTDSQGQTDAAPRSNAVCARWPATVCTRSGCRLCCRRRRCRSSLPTQLPDALRQPSRHDLSAFSTTTPRPLLSPPLAAPRSLCPLSCALVRRSRRRRWRRRQRQRASRHPLFCTPLKQLHSTPGPPPENRESLISSLRFEIFFGSWERPGYPGEKTVIGVEERRGDGRGIMKLVGFSLY